MAEEYIVAVRVIIINCHPFACPGNSCDLALKATTLVSLGEKDLERKGD